MSKVSVIMPARNERWFVAKTVNSIFENARGDYEIILILDGYWPNDDEFPVNRPNLTILHLAEKQGMRPAINAGARVAKGDYLLKCDAHCAFGEGFDVTLAAECDDDWVVVPRRCSLDAKTWGINPKLPIDYHFLSSPWAKPNEPGLHGIPWSERARDRKDVLIDDEMSSQGSCWFMSRKQWDRLGGLSCEGYGDFVQEFQEIGLKTWLGGGQVKVNKKTWYAHLHKGKEFGRGYFISKPAMNDGIKWSLDYWTHNRWPDRVHDLSWLVQKFWPVPTWGDDWERRLREY